MSTRNNKKNSQKETSLKAYLRQEIDKGLAASRDPKNAGLPDLAPRTTTMYSSWYTRTCPVCKHKFREGDRVRLCPLCQQAYHDDDQYNLHCWQKQFSKGKICREGRFDPITDKEIKECPFPRKGKFSAVETAQDSKSPAPTRRIAQITEQFLHGLENVWTPFGEESVIEVPEGSSIVGHKCPWCRFQVRAGDRVVKCPCGKCNTYFHDDIYRHLTCWNEWNGSRGHDYCPTTGEKIKRKPLPAQTGNNRGR